MKQFIPEIVQKAIDTAERNGFEKSCRPEVGRFLRTISGHLSGARIAEIGTGCGVGSAWILSGMTPDSTLYTVEYNVQIANLARDVFEGIDNIHVIQGDWKEILSHAPFHLIFVDAKPAKFDEYDAVIRSVEINGIVILDDFTPEEFWPDDWKGKPDQVRGKWFSDDRIECIELRTSQRNSIIVARRVR